MLLRMLTSENAGPGNPMLETRAAMRLLEHENCPQSSLGASILFWRFVHIGRSMLLAAQGSIASNLSRPFRDCFVSSPLYAAAAAAAGKPRQPENAIDDTFIPGIHQVHVSSVLSPRDVFELGCG